MDLLSHPFRLEPNGTVATVVQGTNQADAEGLAVLALTRKGERVRTPGFGTPDPAHSAVSVADLNVGLADYGPPITVTAITVSTLDNALERVELVFARTDDDQE